MDPSFWYTKRLEGSDPKITFLLLEALHHISQEHGDLQFGQAINEAYHRTYGHTLESEALERVAEVLKADHHRAQEQEKTDTPTAPKKAMGTALMQWLGGLGADHLCIVLADYDPSQAEQLYCETDFRLVLVMADLYTQQQWQSLLARYESSLYGFGGKYKEDRGTDSSEEGMIDLSKGATNSQLKQLRSLGF